MANLFQNMSIFIHISSCFRSSFWGLFGFILLFEYSHYLSKIYFYRHFCVQSGIYF